MAFSKRFPKEVKGSLYPKWEEVFLTEEEEREEEQKAREKNIKLMSESIDDARLLIADKNLKNFQSNVITLAVALFDKRSSHSIYWKENRTKEKFDKANK